MSTDPNPEPTHRPVPDATLAPLSYNMRVAFAPAIRVEPNKGWEFGKKLSEIMEPSLSDLKGEKWQYQQPIGASPNSFLTVIVQSSEIIMNLTYPPPLMTKGWFEDRFALLLKRFHEVFAPKMVLESSTMINGSLPIDGDARTFLATHVMHINPKKTEVFGRPILLVGLRFFFPPFKKKGRKGKEEVTNWQVDVKAESLLENPSRLYLEAHGNWPIPVVWSDDACEEIVKQLAVVDEYMSSDVIAFLQHIPADDGNEG
jgi:hypothetical protein